MRPPCKDVTVLCGLSVPALERVDGPQLDCITGVKEILVEVLPRSRSSSQEERQKIPATKTKGSRRERSALPERNINRLICI